MLGAVLLSLVALSFAQDPACPTFCAQQGGGSTYCYNLGSLKQTDKSKFLTGMEQGQTWKIYVNICGSAKAVGCTVDTPACQDDGQGNFISLGTPASWTMTAYYDPTQGPQSPIIADGGVTVSINNGAVCGNPVNKPRKAFFWFKCNPATTSLPTGSINVQEMDPQTHDPTTCAYYFDPIPYSQFCPGAAGGGGFDYGWVFVIIVLVGLFVYFVAGIIILKFALHKEGVEVIPQHEFWTSLPGLVWDGMKYAFCCVPCRGGSYTSV